MKISFAERCCWRGTYLYANSGRQIARVTFDPKSYPNPSLTFGLLGRSLTIKIPVIRWSAAYKYQFLMPTYKLQQRVLHAIDGRNAKGKF